MRAGFGRSFVFVSRVSPVPIRCFHARPPKQAGLPGRVRATPPSTETNGKAENYACRPAPAAKRKTPPRACPPPPPLSPRYDACIGDGYEGLGWCATTADYDADGAWGGCLPCGTTFDDDDCAAFPAAQPQDGWLATAAVPETLWQVREREKNENEKSKAKT